MVRWRGWPEWERLGLGVCLFSGALAWGRGAASALGWDRANGGAMALGRGLGLAAVFLALLVLGALVLEWRKPSPRVSGLLARVGVVLTATTVAFGGFWVIYPIVGESTTVSVTRLLGALLLASGVVGLASWPVLPARRGVVPQALGLLGLGLFDSLASQTLPLVLGAAVGVVALAFERRRSSAAGRTVARWLWLGGAIATSLGLAYGIGRVLPWAQPHVEQAVARSLSGQEASTGIDFSDQARLGEYAKLGISKRVALRVWAREPRLLRARVLNRFDGRVWSRGTLGPVAVGPALAPLAGDVAEVLDTLPGQTLVRLARQSEAGWVAPGSAARVVLAQSTNGGLFVPAGVGALRLAGAGAMLDEAGVARVAGLWAGDVYGFALASAPMRGGDPTKDDLSLPVDLDPRFQILAKRLGAGSAPPEEYVRRVVAHFERELVYSLDVGEWKSSQPVAEFLFEKKRGYCEYFASAAALLLRAGGVPSRFVSGFSVRDTNALGDHFVVRESDAHAWIDVLLPGRGWVEADPTPPAQFAAVHDGDRPGRLAQWLEALRATWSELIARVRAQGLGVLGWVLRGAVRHPVQMAVLALAVWGLARAWRWLRGRKRSSRQLGRIRHDEVAGVPRELVDLVVRVERAWEKEGVPRHASRALLDHLGELVSRQASTERREVERLVIDAYYRARFGGVPPMADELAALSARWSASSPGGR